MRTRTKTWRPHFEILEDRSVPSTFAAFGLDAPAAGPFPSDRFSVADSSQLTNRRVNLPLPDATTRPSDYSDLSVINTLDGFNLQPRVSIPFSGPIDVTTVNSSTVFLIKLADPTSPEEDGGQVVGINQTVWDVATNTLHVESDELLDQHTRYALIVTRGMRDADGLPIEPSADFERFRHDLNFGQTADPDLMEYRNDLLDALSVAELAGVKPKDVVTASVFTTQSATAVLEKIRDQIHAATPAPADFHLAPGGERSVFPLDDITGITWSQQTRVGAPLSPVSLAVELTALRDLIPGAVGRVAYGKYTSPEYLIHPGEFIPPVATRTGIPQVQQTMDVYFNVILPSGPMPPNGWPVAIYGTGGEGAKDTWLLRVAGSMAAQGIATVSINFYGRGFGSESTITVQRASAGPVTFLAGGRSIDQNGDGALGGTEGFQSQSAMVDIRDSYRQTAIDWMQLVRTIQAGVDVDGDGSADLDSSRIYQFGNSTGGNMGTIFTAIEPGVRAAVFNATGGSVVDWSRLSGVTARMRIGQALDRRTPALRNSPGISVLDGVPIQGPFFNENLPLRNGVPLRVGLADGTSAVIQSPVINTVPGATAIQEVLEHQEWVMMSGDPLAYAPHLRKDPLAGVSAKPVIIQSAKGDRNIPNPTVMALARAGDLADRVTFYRHDLAFAEDPTLDGNPHQFLVRVVGNAGERRIALGYQSQIAAFFASDGEVIIHPAPSRFFETPIAGSLPEHLNFIATDPPIITITDAGVTEGDGGVRILTFTVTLTRTSDQSVSVNFGTFDGTATAGEDYEAASGTLVFAPGETTKTISIVIKPDKKKEGKENFFVKLWQADNALLVDDLGVCTIFDDD